MTPKISVIMSFYNGQKYIGQSVKSILAQTYTNFEFIIINDGSKDKSEQIIKSFKDKRIKIIKNKKNMGLTKSLNIGIKNAKGEFIARIDSDDISMPNRFEKQLEFLQKHTDIGLVGSSVEFINQNGESTGTKKFLATDKEIRKNLTSYLPFRHSALMIRKKVLDDVGYYDENYIYAQDYELVLRISAKYKLANLPEVLLQYRNWFGSISFKKLKRQEYFALKARLKALKGNWVPFWQTIYLIKPAISFLVPAFVKKPIVKTVYKFK